MLEFTTIFFLLVCGHALMDYPLQSEFMAVGKGSRLVPHNGVPWYHCLGAHSLLHALAVGLITGSLLLAIAEAVAHFIIDDMKCRKWISIHTDQVLHAYCKFAIAYFYVMGWADDSIKIFLAKGFA